MRSTLCFAVLCFFVCSLSGERSSLADAGDELLLDKGLEHWDSNGIKQWKYEDDVLTGTWSGGATSHPHLVALYSKKKYRDFEFKFQVRGKTAHGSAVGFRSEIEKTKFGLQVGGLVCYVDDGGMGSCG